MPICRWPTTEQYPWTLAEITPASSSAVAPGAMRGVRADPITRSCVVVSAFLKSTISRSPAATVTLFGT